MKDKKRFVKSGLLPDSLPEFPHAYSWNDRLWVFEQPTDYFRRHELLHEGVHCFMNTMLGGCGAPWYMEGMAEMLGTHAWGEGKLTLDYFPQSAEEVPGLGRIRLIHDAVAAGRALPLDKISKFPGSLLFTNESYAWCWAAAKFLDSHPRYQKRFRELFQNVSHADFNGEFYVAYAQDLPELCEEWQVFIAGLEHGYDISRTVIDFAPGQPMADNNDQTSVNVSSARGWQNSGIRLEGGRKYELTASGRWTKKCRPAFWNGLKSVPDRIAIESGGISIRYYQDRPLGILLAAVRPDHPNPDHPSVFLHPIAVGLQATLTVPESGTLFFKINDTVADLSSNEGGVKVEINQIK